MSITTMWTHGNALVVEDPGEYASIRHRGWGTELSYNNPGDDDNYRVCHIPLPTLTSVDGESPKLSKVTILYETGGGAFIERVDVWDATQRIAQFPGIYYDKPLPPTGFSGYQSHLSPDRYNVLLFDPPYEAQSGIGISLLVALTGASSDPNVPSDPLTVMIAGVGADFVFPMPVLRRVVATETIEISETDVKPAH